MIRETGAGQVFVTVISARRPGNVERMRPLIGGATWIIPAEDHYAYREAGLDAAEIKIGNSLVGARNKALELAWDHMVPCVQVSDDLKGIKIWASKKEAHPIEFDHVLAKMLDSLEMNDFKLVGCAPTDNPFYGNDTTSRNLFVVGDLILVKPCELLFDVEFHLKEDYDYTCQHVLRYGGAQRLNYILPSFEHRTNAGGAVSIRTPEEEQKAIARLKAKWPGWIKDNPRRPNEILLKIPRG